jgi:hypothetical protein
MAIVGRNAAVVQAGPMRLSRLAWVSWGLLHLTYLPATASRMTTGLKYLWWHLSHENANRVLIEPAAPKPSEAAFPPPSLSPAVHARVPDRS